MDLADLDATAQAALVASGEASAVELVDAAIERIERLDSELNAVVHPRFDKAREDASGDLPDGPFRGVPLLVKDLWTSMAGEPHYLGLRLLKEADRRAEFDSNIIKRYREAGFVIVGRTNTAELGLSATTEPLIYGPTRNPWDTDFSPGGSSGGSAAAVASGLVPIANATDVGGSIRIPASACGLVGLKPSRGRVSMGPSYEEWGRMTQHALATSMRDCAQMLDCSAGAFAGDGVVAPVPARPYVGELGGTQRKLRVGLMIELDGKAVDDECAEAATIAAGLLEAAGHEVTLAHPDAIQMLPELHDHNLKEIFAATAARLDGFAAELGVEITADDVEPAVWLMMERGRDVLASEWIAAFEFQQRFRRAMATWWDSGFDLLLTPTTAAVTPPIGKLVSSPEDPLAGLTGSAPYLAFTSMFNVTGQPAISLPVHVTDSGLPVGAQLVAAYGREDLLIAVGAELERSLDWTERRAPLHA